MTTIEPSLNIMSSSEDLIGNTPIRSLKRVAANVPARVAVKLEYLNPGGSSKDRAAKFMLDAAEREGLLKPGGTIIEPTSGNTGLALAMLASERGYKTVFVVTTKVGQEKVSLLKAFGAQVEVCPVEVEPDDPRSYYSVAKRLAKETPNSFRPDQYSNPNNPQAHYETTGPEIWRQTAGKITHFVAGMGTGGTISGVAQYLKEQNPNIKIIGADPVNSVYNGGSGRPYLIEGVGEDFFPTTYDGSLVDEIIPVSDADAITTALEVAKQEGLLVGGSGALAIEAARRIQGLNEDDLIVILLPDSGERYLSTIYNEQWRLSRGFSDASDEDAPLVRDLLNDVDANFGKHKIIYVNPDTTVRDAIRLMQEHGISQLPVAKNEPPFAHAEIIGSLDSWRLLPLVAESGYLLDEPVVKVMEKPLAVVGIGESVERRASELLEVSPGLLVLDGGLPVSVITQSDLLAFYSNRTQQRGGLEHDFR